VARAEGHVLINGLGIGMVLGAVLKRPKVTAVTVVEIDPTIIAMVWPHYQDPRVTMVQDDAFTFKPPPGARYGAVWHDIWDFICLDNLPQMSKLKRRYGRWAGWQGCWSEHECRRRRRYAGTP
jgi:predicted membrane-bound spermidine synthase